MFHDRIVVLDDTEELTDTAILAVPRTVELKQMSAATDIYGIEPVCLYTVFCNGADPERKWDEAVLDDKFGEMIAAFENPTYFNQLWPRLEHLRRQLEEHAEKRTRPEDMPHKPYDPLGKEDGNVMTLHRASIRDVRNMINAVPGVFNILRVLKYNVAHFVFFMHFVLCCLHRRSDINGESHVPGKTALLPFCQNRLVKPSEDGPASAAFKRLEALEDIVIREQCQYFETNQEEFPKGPEVIQPDPVIRQQNAALKEEREQIHQENATLKEERVQIRQQNATLKEEREQMRQQNATLKEEREQMRQQNATLKDVLAQVGALKNSLSNNASTGTYPGQMMSSMD